MAEKILIVEDERNLRKLHQMNCMEKLDLSGKKSLHSAAS